MKRLLTVTSFEATSPSFNITDENKSLSDTTTERRIPGGGEELNNKMLNFNSLDLKMILNYLGMKSRT